MSSDEKPPGVGQSAASAEAAKAFAEAENILKVYNAELERNVRTFFERRRATIEEIAKSDEPMARNLERFDPH